MIDPSLKKKLVHEDRWSRTYEAGDDFYAFESKFEADGVSVSIDDLSSGWDSWSDAEKLSFVNAYRSKPRFFKSDEQILEFLIARGKERILSTIALTLALHHSNKKMVLEFLLDRLNRGVEPKSNFIQALYILGDKGAVPHLRALHDHLSVEVRRADGTPDRSTVCDFLKCCEGLFHLEKIESDRDEIRPFLEHADEIVRIQAQMAFAGPQPEEFGLNG